MTQIISLSGKMQSGKTTLGLFTTGIVLAKLNICDHFNVTDTPELWVSDLFGQNSPQGGYMMDMFGNHSGDIAMFFNEEIFPHIKLYSFADPLKEFLMNVFGLSWEGMYGTNEQKNALTNLLWESFPAEVHNGKTGQMTNREVMQAFGTEIVRKIYGPAWAKAALRKIAKEAPKVAVLVDCRFPDEADETHAYGGTVVRLTRNLLNNQHKSETALDNYENFDYIIQNDNLSLVESCNFMLEILQEIGVVD